MYHLDDTSIETTTKKLKFISRRYVLIIYTYKVWLCYLQIFQSFDLLRAPPILVHHFQFSTRFGPVFPIALDALLFHFDAPRPYTVERKFLKIEIIISIHQLFDIVYYLMVKIKRRLSSNSKCHQLCTIIRFVKCEKNSILSCSLNRQMRSPAHAFFKI